MMYKSIPYEKSFAYYIEVELGLNLDDIWNWEKNNKNGINPYEISKSSSKKVWLYCLEKDYHNDYGGYKITCNNFYRGDRCSYCSHKGGKNIHPRDSFAQWGIDNFGEDFLDKYWSSYNTLNPWELSPQSNKKIYLYCQVHDYHNFDRENNKVGYNTTCSNFYSGRRCSYCNSFASHKVHWRDSLAYNYPNIANMIAIEENNLIFEDCYNITCKSNKKFYFKCLDCGNISTNKKDLSLVMCQRYSCEFCSDGISIPNKIMANILKQLNIDFITELSSKEFSGKNFFYYDFYLPKYNMIIEVNGIQHYEETNRGRNLFQEQMNDLFKYKCAKNHVDKYIVIDCRQSELKWLRENITKELGEYFDLSKINWELAWKEGQSSKVIECWDLWNSGLEVKNIADKMHISKVTVRSYLKRGTESEKCNYSKENSKKSRVNKIKK